MLGVYDMYRHHEHYGRTEWNGMKQGDLYIIVRCLYIDSDFESAFFLNATTYAHDAFVAQ